MIKTVLVSLCFFVLSVTSSAVLAQQGQWTWMKGSSSSNATGTYGTQGVPNDANTPPALYSPFTWTDLSGNFWLYGGLRYDNGVNYAYAALWKFQPDSNRWTWINGPSSPNQNPHYGTIGVPSPTNQPGSRGFAGPAWVDADGNFWLYGGAGYADIYSDLWKYDLSTGEWTCMGNYPPDPNHGVLGTGTSATTPGERTETTAAWTDAVGDLWFFGGLGFNGTCADGWKYEMSSGNWIWMNGDSVENLMGVPPVYGSQGIFSSSNAPGGRFVYCHWKDGNGKFWLYGGGNSSYHNYADLWEFDPVTNQWAWISGDTSDYYPGNYTSTCDSISLPRCGSENRAVWVDQSAHVWKLSGTATGSYNPTNDLMVLDPVQQQWVWVSGTTALNPDGVYGTMGVPDPANVPGGRFGSVGWMDQSGNLWYFGGRNSFVQDYNTLWKYVPDPDCPVFSVSSFPPAAQFSVSDSSVCSATCLSFTDLSQNSPTSWHWEFPGGTPSSSSDQNPVNICYYTPGTYDVTLVATNAAGSDTVMLASFITVSAEPSAAITQSNDTLYSSAGMSYQWYTNGNIINGATNNFYVPSSEDYYSVMLTDSNGCMAADTIFFSLAPQPAFSVPDTSICEKFCIDFFDQSTNNPTSWNWNFPGGVPSSSTLQNPTQICYNNPGNYDVTLITTNAFGSDTLSLTGFITVYPTPAFPVITQTGYTLTSSPAYSYQWQLNTSDIPGATNQSYTVLQTGYYTVIVGDSNGCVNSASEYVLISGIDEVVGDENISIYPNPSSGSFTVEWGNDQMPDSFFPGVEELSIDVVNTLGQVVFNAHESSAPGTTKRKIEIDLNDTARGIYFIEIKTPDRFIKKKVVIAF